MLQSDFTGPWGISSDYGSGGWFHVYAFTMLFGMALAIFASWYKLRRYQIPTDGLALLVIFVIPASLFGASWFGKNDPLNPIGFWEHFAFWKAGLSIHGGVLFGLIVGSCFFGIYKRKTNVSLLAYADCIIPNILLGQVVGRWGNFFNHELLGEVVGYSATLDGSGIAAINWLPAFIRDNAFELILGGPQKELINGEYLYVFRAPIFLYESLSNLGLWALITFVLPKSFRWFSKKPWKIESEKYKLNTSFNLKSKRKFWREAFYDYKVNQFTVKKLNEEYKTRKEEILVTQGKSLKRIHLINQAYYTRSKKLYYLNNPNNYLVMRSGVQMGLYFFGWNLIRFCIELQRPDDHLFIINNRTLDYIVLISIFVSGLIFAILSQFVFAKYNRKSNWTYEKQY